MSFVRSVPDSKTRRERKQKLNKIPRGDSRPIIIDSEPSVSISAPNNSGKILQGFDDHTPPGNGTAHTISILFLAENRWNPSAFSLSAGPENRPKVSKRLFCLVSSPVRLSLDAYGDLIVMPIESFGVELSASTHLIARGAELSDDIYDSLTLLYIHTPL